MVSLGCTTVALAALLAHVLELPNKLALPGPLWLAVQQNLYRGWGAILGPFEVGAVVSTWALVPTVNYRHPAVSPSLAQRAVAVWTPQTLPADWPAYRLQWELGHALRALLCAIALGALVRAAFGEAVTERMR